MLRTEKIFDAVHQIMGEEQGIVSRIKKSLSSIKFEKSNFTASAHAKMDHLYGYSSVEDSLKICGKFISRGVKDIPYVDRIAKSIYERKMTSAGPSKRLTIAERSAALFERKLTAAKEQIAQKMTSCQTTKNSHSACKIMLDIEELTCCASVYERRIEIASLERKHILMPSCDRKDLIDKAQAVEEFLQMIWKMYSHMKNPIRIKTGGEEIEYPQFIRINLLSFFTDQVQQVLVKSPDCRLTPTLRKIKEEIIDTVEFWREHTALMRPSTSLQHAAQNPLYFL